MGSTDWHYLNAQGSAWRLALADIDGEGRKSLAYGSFQGWVRAMNPESGRERWAIELGGSPFALKAFDLDGDGRDELYCACADGHIYAIGPDGKSRWTVEGDSRQPMYDVAAGCLRKKGERLLVGGGTDRWVRILDSKGKPVASHLLKTTVQRLAVADFDGDGLDEIFVADGRETAEMLKLRGDAAGGFALEVLWRKELEPIEYRKRWDNPGGVVKIFSLDAGDLDGDGAPELVFGDAFPSQQSIMAIRADGAPIWETPSLEWWNADETWYEYFSTAFVRMAKLRSELPGLQVVSASGGLVRLHGADGTLLGSAESRLAFSDLVVDGSTLYLASTPNGDNVIYRVDMSGDWESAVSSLERRGLAREIGETIANLRARVLEHPGVPDTRGGSFPIQMLAFGAGEKSCERYRRSVAVLQAKLPYDNLEYVASITVIEPTPPLDDKGEPWFADRWKVDSFNKSMTPDEIVEAARMIEREKIPAYFRMGHSCMPFITLETAERVLQAAPTWLRGFATYEDEDPERFRRYFGLYHGPLADLCKKYGDKKVMTTNKNVWAITAPSMPESFEGLCGKGRGDQTVISTEDSNSRTPEINLFGRMGLRQAGLIKHFQASVIQDLFSFCRFHEWEMPKHGHPYLRLLVAHAACGADWFRIRMAHMHPYRGETDFTQMGRESTEIFLHLLGKGLVFTPRPDQMAGISPIGFAVHEPEWKWLFDAHNGHRIHRWEEDDEMRDAVIPHGGCMWGNTPTPEHALQRVLMNKKRQFGLHIPPTPYGTIAFVPVHADLGSVNGVREWWHTNGLYVWREGGPKLNGMEAARALRASFEEAAKRLPFRALGDDLFLQSVRIDEGRFRIYAVDPGWVDPEDRRVELRTQLPGKWEIRDLLSGEELKESRDGDQSVELRVPAGAFRILEAARRA